ncbi:hypothetical protein GY21_01495 [Cryobacterium roopkundense]|uniref:Putative OB-fold protein n=1 Tax=Cryobacterium roopkundense TaxID=1001240 RepID=A0A099JUB9_9MICO|nr:zf-TFIIB domain-containing protein [Cryobacterium roopkundense]KGJ81776.1 hypothetical protein GY21_01495 [Cryobacterium roopkundense]MBB5642413.1 putative OB-fold protein [Cryobacterium roopkundense]
MTPEDEQPPDLFDFTEDIGSGLKITFDGDGIIGPSCPSCGTEMVPEQRFVKERLVISERCPACGLTVLLPDVFKVLDDE